MSDGHGNSNMNGPGGGPYAPNDYMGGEPLNRPDDHWMGIWRGTL
jgi:hypothetical protein